MAKKVLRSKVIELRQLGYTYTQIKRELGVSKSTLSGWLRNLPLTNEQLQLLTLNRQLSEDLRIERFRQTYKRKWINRLNSTLEKQKHDLLPLSEKELFIAGIFLYWGEGSKQKGLVSISNTNPEVIQFAFYWLTQILKIPKEKITVRLHLYVDMDVDRETGYWSQLLGISELNFKSPYIKSTTRDKLTYKSFGHGTCNLICCDTYISEKVAMSIKAISQYCGAKSELVWYN